MKPRAVINVLLVVGQIDILNDFTEHNMSEEIDKEKLEKDVVSKLEEYRSWSDSLTKDEVQSLDERKPSKRKSHPETSPVPIKKKKVGPPQPKNAVQTLNEYKAGHYHDDGS